MTGKRYLAGIGIALMFAVPSRAAERSTSADFLRIEPSARAAALGGGFGALVDDVHGLYYNPAGLALVGRTQLTATHTEWLAGVQNEYFGMAFPLGPLAWGFSAAYLHSEETERDDAGRPVSTFVVGDGALTLGLGARLSDRHHVGLGTKFIQRTLYHRSANGFAADLGYQYRLETPGGTFWKFGLTLRNAGPKFGFSVKEKMPAELELSLAYQPAIALRRPVTLALAVKDGSFFEQPVVTVGFEAALFSRFFLRGGYVVDETKQRLRAGFGVDLFDLGRVDFAAVRLGQFNSSLFLSLTLQLSKKGG